MRVDLRGWIENMFLYGELLHFFKTIIYSS